MPKLFYFAYDHNEARGGQKDTYLHVDLLNRNGFEAYVLHSENGFRLNWFENNTPVVGLETFGRIYESGTDYVVLPEDFTPESGAHFEKTIIFNKGLYNGFVALGHRTPLPYLYRLPQVKGAFSVSEHNATHLRFAFPDLPVYYVSLGIDTDIFRYVNAPHKHRQIAYVIKNIPVLSTVYHMLHARAEAGLNLLRTYRWVPLQGFTEAEVSHCLQESLMLLFLSVEEGMPRTALEAMACGCLVLGHGAGPLLEILLPEFQFPYGDCIAAVRSIEGIANSFVERPDMFASSSDKSRAIALRYSKHKEQETVLCAWESLFQKDSTYTPKWMALT
ncbi:MAG TPA: glycosyltransferase [Bryobacteraceae bacterium]|nr:glycosyltransferase [Bryobacteraceae bacterium]